MFTFKPWKARLLVIAAILLATWGSYLFFSHLPQQSQTKPLGATFQTADAVALFETSLTSSISASATSFNLNASTYNSGISTLASSTYGIILDEGTVTEELVLADCTGGVCTNATRGIDRWTGTTTVPSLQFAHRRGASAKMTDAPSLLFAINVFKGRQNVENVMSYNSALSFSTTSNQIPSARWVSGISNTASTSVKSYVDSSFLNLTNNSQTVSGNNTYSGVLTFSGVPVFSSGAAFNTILPQSSVVPVSGSDLVNKTYADGLAIAGAPNASTIQKGIVEIATAKEAGSSTPTGSTGALLALPASMSTSTSQVATTSIVATNYYGKIDSSFFGTTTFPLPTTFSATTTITSTSTLVIGAFPAYNIGKNVKIFTSNGTFLIPSGISKVHVLVIGGGGGGGGANSGCSPNCFGGPAGGGGWAMAEVDVSATTSVAITVGAAGTGGATTPADGVDGGTSKFSTFVSATGGTKGGLANTNGSVGSAGPGGTGVGGDINVPGGAGITATTILNLGGASYGPLNSGGPGVGGRGIGNSAGSSGVDGLVAIYW